jgi:threonine dehydratase
MVEMDGALISDEMIVTARAAGSGVVAHTPVMTSAALTDRCGGRVVMKAEHLQRTGSFKIRGAMSKLASLGASATRGVTAGSAGNHAQALAFAARQASVPCQIFVPHGAPIGKIEACQAYGATVIEGGASLDEAVAAAVQRAADSGMSFCHPYDDPFVVAGQATLGLELLDDIADLSLLVVPLGGGGLASGVAVAVKRRLPHVRVVGVQAATCAPYVTGDAPDGAVVTLADGIAVKRPGAVTGPLVEAWLDDIVTVDENGIAAAMVLLMERAKFVVEGAGAVGVAALLGGEVGVAADGTTCVVLSGGNVDLGVIPGLIRRHETNSGRRLLLTVRISDRPGGLARLLAVIGEQGANLIEVHHVREGLDLLVRETAVNLVLEIRGRSHGKRVIEAIDGAGYIVGSHG